MIGQRLKVARSAVGLSLRDLEKKINSRVTAQAIGKYERNESMPSSGVLIALADALGVTEDYLLGEQTMALDGVEFRKKSLASKKEEAQLEARALHLLERYLLIEEMLNISPEWDRPRGAPFPIVNDTGEAERAARSVRDAWDLGMDPIPNLVELFEERGLKVLSVELTNIDGLTATVRRPGKAPLPVIAVNKTAWSERKRFTLAHELGHMVLAVAHGLDEERACNRFAGALLMPAEALWAEVGKHRTSISLGELARLKELFGVSLQAIAYRCKDLGIFDQATLTRLFKIFTQRGWRRPPFEEIGALDPKLEEPRRLERLCFRALAEGAISESKTAEILGISVRQLNRLMDTPEAA
ncbi:helix-turn-helix domain-containing protein [Marinibaculum pumilum]|uniref:Helix-turn-helix domain-containing protein n=1 Tax=Marinibaculum pumilum TaxID=1766165 RepID=A0ABV7L7I5_9PROT